MVKEEEIRPQAIFDEYIRLAAIDTDLYFKDVERVEIECPACGGKGDAVIKKSGFVYDQCRTCKTLYVNPRPGYAAFAKYYKESASTEYWATTFYQETEDARREKLWKPKAKEIRDIMAKFSASTGARIIDIGGGYGTFAEEVTKLGGPSPVIVEPGPQLAQICRSKGFLVVEKFLEDVGENDLPSCPKVFVSFELFEHLHDPTFFMMALKSLMSSGDIFIFTTLSGTGLDIQALWEDSKGIMPPHHLNFFNPKSVSYFLMRFGFEVLEIKTPGKLDIDILENSRNLIKDRFWKTFIETASDEEKEKCQHWIADQGLSSHMWAICRKP